MISNPQLMPEDPDLARDIATQGGNYTERVAGHNIHAHTVVIHEAPPPISPPVPPASPEEPCKKRKQVAFVIDGSLKDLDPTKLAKLQALVRAIQQLTGDASLTVVDILAGSIRLILEGSKAGLERLQELFDEGDLTKILGFSASAVEPVEVEIPRANLLKGMLITAITINTQGAQNCDLSEADLSGAYLSRADLREAILSRANLSRANLSGAYLSEADLSKADLSRADLSRADLREAILSGANLSEAILSGAILRRAILRGAILSGANLREAILSEAILTEAILTEAILNRVNLREAILSGADLGKSDLSEANLSEADLSEADLITANLSKVNLSRANLSGADLSGAYLNGTNLSGADLSRANLSGANVEEALFIQSTGLSEAEKADLRSRGAIFEDTPGDRASTLAPVQR